MEIKILGPGCAKCDALEQLVGEVVAECGIDARITKVQDIVEIMRFGVMTTPALMVDGRIVLKGKVPSAKEIQALLTK